MLDPARATTRSAPCRTAAGVKFERSGNDCLVDDTAEPTSEDRRRRPAGASDELVEAIGTASEGFEYLERARGHLYSFHQLVGRADLLFGRAADQLEACGAGTDAERLQDEIVGRNVLEGRWTFQVVEEFDDGYYEPVRDEVRRIEERLLDGRRHVYESELKERRRSAGRPGHERSPSEVERSSEDHRGAHDTASD